MKAKNKWCTCENDKDNDRDNDSDCDYGCVGRSRLALVIKLSMSGVEVARCSNRPFGATLAKLCLAMSGKILQ